MKDTNKTENSDILISIFCEIVAHDLRVSRMATKFVPRCSRNTCQFIVSYTNAKIQL